MHGIGKRAARPEHVRTHTATTLPRDTSSFYNLLRGTPAAHSHTLERSSGGRNLQAAPTIIAVVVDRSTLR